VTRYYIETGLGDSVDEPTPEQMLRVLEALDPGDEEHGAAWVGTTDDTSMEWNVDGRMVYSRPRRRVLRHLLGVSRDRAVDLWVLLAAGRFEDLEAEPWKPGNGFVMTPERQREIDAASLAVDRGFYDSLGPERANTPCRRAGCKRGAVELSVLCRPHHFESLRGRPSPFDH
jgi:hypothetical protein